MLRTLKSTAALALITSTLVASVAAQDFYVAPSERELLVFITLAPSTSGPIQDFYEFVEFSADTLATSTLASRYGAVHVLKGSNATRQNFINRLNTLTAPASLKALDVIFVTHGLSGSVAFNDVSVTSAQLQAQVIAGVSASRRAKFRMLFSTACFGESHRSAWRNMGFKVASGSREVYADSALSYQPFLSGWRNYGTFYSAVKSANDADPLRIQDGIASGLLWAAGSSAWDDVDSVRLRSGYTTTVTVTRQMTNN